MSYFGNSKQLARRSVQYIPMDVYIHFIQDPFSVYVPFPLMSIFILYKILSMYMLAKDVRSYILNNRLFGLRYVI